MKEVLLHIGPHKTGSTALQRALQASPESLAQKGWYYESFPAFRNGQHGMADSLHTGGIDKVRANFRLTPPRDGLDRVIISSENFSRLNAEAAGAFLELFQAEKVRVVYYLRNPLDRLLSSWKELVKHGYEYSLLEFLAGSLAKPMENREFNDAVRLDAWAEVLGKSAIEIHLFDAVTSVPSHFAATYLGTDSDWSAGGVDRVNISGGMVHSEALRALNGYQRYIGTSEAVRAEFKDLVDALSEVVQSDGWREIPLSLDHPIFSAVERNLIDEYGDRILDELPQRGLFEVRDTSWRYVSPNVWLRHGALNARLFRLRRRLKDEIGPPQIDVRLKKLC